MSGIVRLYVRESRAPFDVHLELLCACSPYFDRLFRKRTKKSPDDQAIHLSDMEPDLFAEILLWIYRCKHSLGGLQRKRMKFLLKLWLLAKNHEILELQDSLLPFLEGRAEEDTREIPDLRLLQERSVLGQLPPVNYKHLYICNGTRLRCDQRESPVGDHHRRYTLPSNTNINAAYAQQLTFKNG